MRATDFLAAGYWGHFGVVRFVKLGENRSVPGPEAVKRAMEPCRGLARLCSPHRLHSSVANSAIYQRIPVVLSFYSSLWLGEIKSVGQNEFDPFWVSLIRSSINPTIRLLSDLQKKSLIRPLLFDDLRNTGLHLGRTARKRQATVLYQKASVNFAQ